LARPVITAWLAVACVAVAPFAQAEPAPREPFDAGGRMVQRAEAFELARMALRHPFDLAGIPRRAQQELGLARLGLAGSEAADGVQVGGRRRAQQAGAGGLVAHQPMARRRGSVGREVDGEAPAHAAASCTCRTGRRNRPGRFGWRKGTRVMSAS
jgi:hypothetical protein